VYARVSAELKQAVDDYAEERGMSLASAVSDLLETGLEGASNAQSIKSLEIINQQLQGDLAQARQAGNVLDSRLRQQLGRCHCGAELTGRDFLVSGQCPACSRGIASLLTGQNDTAGTVDRLEVAPFLAGLGAAAALITLIYVASQS
jgi:hypothetical protein